MKHSSPYLTPDQLRSGLHVSSLIMCDLKFSTYILIDTWNIILSSV